MSTAGTSPAEYGRFVEARYRCDKVTGKALDSKDTKNSKKYKSTLGMHQIGSWLADGHELLSKSQLWCQALKSQLFVHHPSVPSYHNCFRKAGTFTSIHICELHQHHPKPYCKAKEELEEKDYLGRYVGISYRLQD